MAVILLASGEAMTAYVGGKVNGKYGRNYPFAFAFVLDVSSYVVCLNWQITENTTWVIYILSFMFGMSDTLWQSQTNGEWLDRFVFWNYVSDVPVYIYWPMF